MTAARGRDPLASSRSSSRWWAGLSLVVLGVGGALFATAWLIGGEDATSDNWVGLSVVMALFVGLVGSFVALVTAAYAGLRHRDWSGLWLPLVTFPAVVLAVGLLEAFVLE